MGLTGPVATILPPATTAPELAQQPKTRHQGGLSFGGALLTRQHSPKPSLGGLPPPPRLRRILKSNPPSPFGLWRTSHLPGDHLCLHLLRELEQPQVLVNSCASVIEGPGQLGLIRGVLPVQGLPELQCNQERIGTGLSRNLLSFQRNTALSFPDPIGVDRELHLKKCRVRVSLGEL